NAVKDELSKDERPALLSELIEKAVKIDNRIYERQRERTFGQQTSSSFGRHNNQTNYGPEPMQLDATMSSRPSTFNKTNNPPPNQQNNSSSKRLTSSERQQRMDNNLCLYCGKPGHKVSQCFLAKGKNSVSASSSDPAVGYSNNSAKN
ncbi:MAG: hypothetical protein M4579_007612, partial [Chaenotheca gracillima]